MNEADYSMTDQAMNNQGRTAGDDHMLVKFYYDTVLDRDESERQGRAVHTSKEFVSIRQPGDKDSEVIKPVNDLVKQRWPKHYAAFKAREEQVVEGTALSEWPQMERHMVEDLKYLGIHTVEQLAAVSDANTANVMGLSTLKQKAADFLAQQDNSAALQKTVEDQAAQIAALMATVEELKAGQAVEQADEVAPPKRRGRPPKKE